MQRNLIRPIQSSFLSCEKDVNLILKRLFVENRKYSDQLKRLLVINNADCLDSNDPAYVDIVNRTTVSSLKKDNYITLVPKISMQEHQEKKTRIIISFDNFVTNAKNPEFRDCTVHFDILCHPDCWDLGDFRLRPLKIAGYIDGLLNNTKLTGIGTFNFLGCSELVLDQNLSGYSLMYQAIHGSDDLLPENQ